MVSTLTSAAPPEAALPPLTDTTVGPALTSASHRKRSAGTVLLVDDDEAICNFAATMLEWIGLKTVLACNGLEALLALQKHPEVDAVFLDVLMPVMNGEDAFREMRKYWPELPVILMSGFDQSELIHRFGSQQPEAFVRKPFTSENLFSAFRNALRQ